MKEYALVKYNRPVRFYVPTHSLISYTQISMVSPESSLLDVPSVDGYIAQIWTGTAKWPSPYRGRTAERVFESAFLEYGVAQELVRGTGRRMWLLNDPIEDDPHFTWDRYRKSFICTLVASLLQPDVCDYEVAPWPTRVMHGKYPADSPAAKSIDDDYATTLSVVANQLRDMDQKDVSWGKVTDGVGVLLADSAMFQRANPAFSAGVTSEANDTARQTRVEAERLASFSGMTFPLVKCGIPIRTVQLDNLVRSPGYLDRYKVLLLSYEFMKPLQPAIHQVLTEWVRNGGTLIYIGADTDPFHQVREWWNQSASPFASPSEHLFQCLGLGRTPKQGEYRCDRGLVLVERRHPAWFSRSDEGADRLVQLVRSGVESGRRRADRAKLAAASSWSLCDCLGDDRIPQRCPAAIARSVCRPVGRLASDPRRRGCCAGSAGVVIGHDASDGQSPGHAGLLRPSGDLDGRFRICSVHNDIAQGRSCCISR